MQKTMEQLAREAYPDPDNKKLFGFNSPLIKGDLNPTNVGDEQTKFEAHDKAIKDYNERIVELNPMYTELSPLQHVIVRCYHLEMKQVSGVYIPTVIQAVTETMNGLGVVNTVSSPWQLSTRAIVIAVPPSVKHLEVGDEVQLHQAAVAPATKNVNELSFHLPNGFMHHSAPGFEAESNIESPHFGYLIVDAYRSIIAKLPKKD